MAARAFSYPILKHSTRRISSQLVRKKKGEMYLLPVFSHILDCLSSVSIDDFLWGPVYYVFSFLRLYCAFSFLGLCCVFSNIDHFFPSDGILRSQITFVFSYYQTFVVVLVNRIWRFLESAGTKNL